MKKAALVLVSTFALCLTVIAQEKQHAATSSAEAKTIESEAKTIESNVRKLWQAFQAKDKVGLAALLTDDFREMEEGAPMGDKKAEVASVDELELLSYTLSDFTFKSVGPDAVLVTYAAQYESKTGSETAKAKSAFGDVWVRQGNAWKALYTQETYLK